MLQGYNKAHFKSSILHSCFNVNSLLFGSQKGTKIGTSEEKFPLIEHEVMCPNLTPAEGFILGVGAKMFTIVGPVIVYGVSASVVYGLTYWITTLF